MTKKLRGNNNFKHRNNIVVCSSLSHFIFGELFFASCFLQVVDHAGSVEEGAALIFTQLERVIKQVHTHTGKHKWALWLIAFWYLVFLH